MDAKNEGCPSIELKKTAAQAVSPWVVLRKIPVYELAVERFNRAVTERKKIFGTDGVRGVANVEPVTAETALKLGRAAAYVFAQMNPRRTPDGARPKIVLGKDTVFRVTCWKTRSWPES